MDPVIREIRKRAANAKEAIAENIVRPFFGFVERLGLWTPIVFLLVATYLISDKTMGPMAKPMSELVQRTKL